MKSTIFLALGAVLVSAGAAAAGEPGGSAALNSSVSGAPLATQYSRGCDCNLPVYNTPFYTVRPPLPPIRVRAPGVRVSSAPVFAPAPAIYVQGPPIYVDAPPVNVAPSQVYLEAPDVHVRPSEVNVAPPEIHFQPAGNHPAEDCCTAVSPPAAGLGAPPPPPPAYPAPMAPPSSGYAQEPGERG